MIRNCDSNKNRRQWLDWSLSSFLLGNIENLSKQNILCYHIDYIILKI